MDDIAATAELLKSARSVVALTGAGISKESGIPTFRDAQTGLWANFNPEDLATPRAFRRDPGLVWRWYDFRRQAVKEAQPNPGHFALAALEQNLAHFVLVTQNVDGLHLRAGSKKIVELHGNIDRHRCFDKNHPAENVQFGLAEPPRCHCGSLVRPDVVWFEEALPESQLTEAFRESESCDVMLVIGTSALVQPAASLPLIAKRSQAKIVEINPISTPLTEHADIYISGPSGVILPHIVNELKKLNSVG
jgi:NAD-dependent deacetylase